MADYLLHPNSFIVSNGTQSKLQVSGQGQLVAMLIDETRAIAYKEILEGLVMELHLGEAAEEALAKSK